MIRKSSIRLPSSIAAAVVAALFAMATCTARAETAAEFYHGKTVRIYVGVSPGGIYSTFALLLTKYMQKHMAGHPDFIVQYMPGASGVRAVEYVYTVAPKDGTAVITPNAGVALRVMLRINKPTYNPAKFIWLGGWGEAVNSVTLLKRNTKVRTIADAKKMQVILGSIGKSSNTYLTPELMKNLLGFKFKIITGYHGGSPIRLAIEKGEVDGWCGQWTGWKLRKPNWVKEGKLVTLVQLASKPTPDLKNVPLLSSLAKNAEQKHMFTLIQTGIADRAIAVPPGVPADRVAALRKAYEDTLHDPAFVKDATARKFDLDPVSGDDIQKYVTDLMSTPKPLVDKMRKAMGLD